MVSLFREEGKEVYGIVSRCIEITYQGDRGNPLGGACSSRLNALSDLFWETRGRHEALFCVSISDNIIQQRISRCL